MEEQNMQTYANQKVIKVNKAVSNKENLYGIINKECMYTAMSDLKYNEFKVFMYISTNQDSYEFALSPQDIANKCGGNKREIQKSIESLIEKGYIRQVKEDSNRYDFFEDSNVLKNNIGDLDDVLENNIPYVEKQHTLCGKTTQPMLKNNIEILQDNTNNTTILHSEVKTNADAFPVKERKYVFNDIVNKLKDMSKEDKYDAIDMIGTDTTLIKDWSEEQRQEFYDLFVIGNNCKSELEINEYVDRILDLKKKIIDKDYLDKHKDTLTREYLSKRGIFQLKEDYSTIANKGELFFKPVEKKESDFIGNNSIEEFCNEVINSIVNEDEYDEIPECYPFS